MGDDLTSFFETIARKNWLDFDGVTFSEEDTVLTLSTCCRKYDKTCLLYTSPASGGLTRPNGDTGSYFMWLDGNGNSYEPGGSVPADVTALTVQWTAPTYTVTLNTNGGTINNGNVTGYTYGVGATLTTACLLYTSRCV